MNPIKKILYLLLVSSFGALAVLLLVFLEEIWVYNMVTPLSGTIERWLPSFREYALYGILIAWVAALVWYVLAQWVLKVNKYKESGKRAVWLTLTLVAILPVIIFSVIQSIDSPLQEGFVIPSLMYLLNFIISFYLPTLLFSPSSFKFAPIPAKSIRRWW